MAQWARAGRGGLASLLIAFTLYAPVAMAQTGVSDTQRGAAEALFEEGRLLKDSGRCAEAVDKFIGSQALDPAVGTQLNIADCYQQIGKPASAWIHFREAAQAARKEGDERRADYAQALADKISPALSKLQITVRRPLAGLKVTKDGDVLATEVWGKALPVDPGPHEIVASAPGHITFRRKVLVEEAGSIVDIEIPALTPRATKLPQDDSGPQPQEIAGWSVFGVGAATAVAGLALGLRARTLDDASLFYCPESPTMCLQQGADLRSEARSFELGAIVALTAGVATMGVGVTVVLTTSDPVKPGTPEPQTSGRRGAPASPRRDTAWKLDVAPWWSPQDAGITTRLSW